LATAEPIYRVYQVTQALRRLLEETFAPLWVEGEVSNFRESPSGHWYFTLKDEHAQLPCVMWRNFVLRQGFRPATGVQVRVWGTLTIYPQGGTYQLQASRVLPVGRGAFLIAFEQLRDRLAVFSTRVGSGRCRVFRSILEWSPPLVGRRSGTFSTFWRGVIRRFG